MDDIERQAFEMMADAHPVECFETYPDEFMEFARKKTGNPDLTKEQIREIIAALDASNESEG